MSIQTGMRNFFRASRARWAKSFGLFNALSGDPDFDKYMTIQYSAENNWPEKARNAAGTDDVEVWRVGTDDKLYVGGNGITPMRGTINFPLATSASIVNQVFFVAPFAMRITAISEIHATANGAAQTAVVEKLTGTQAAGTGVTIMTNTFNMNGTANTLQTGTIPTANPATVGTSYPAYICLAQGDRLALKLSTTITSLAGLVISIAFNPGGKSVLAVYNMQANGDLVDQSFYVANKPTRVTAAYAVVGTKGTDASAVNVQITKDVSTNAPGAGTDTLTNNTNAGFNLKNTINTVETGTFTATAATLRLAVGDRLSVDFAGTLTAVAGLVIVVVLEAEQDRKEITFTLSKNANLVDQACFVADRPYYIAEASAVWGVASATGNIQLTVDKATDAPGAGVDLLSNDTNAGWQTDGTANTPEKALWINTQLNYLLAGDRLSLDMAVGASLAGFTATISLIPC